MRTETAMIISSAFAVGASLLTLLITRLCDYYADRRKEQECFFKEVYQKRIKFYEELIQATDFIPAIEETGFFDTPEKTLHYFDKHYRILIALSIRCVVFGSERVFHAVNALTEAIDQCRDSLCKSIDIGAEININIARRMADARIEIAELIREESGAHVIDERIPNFMRDTKMKKRKPKGVGKEINAPK